MGVVPWQVMLDGPGAEADVVGCLDVCARSVSQRAGGELARLLDGEPGPEGDRREARP
jgi:hypothetical protein